MTASQSPRLPAHQEASQKESGQRSYAQAEERASQTRSAAVRPGNDAFLAPLCGRPRAVLWATGAARGAAGTLDFAGSPGWGEAGRPPPQATRHGNAAPCAPPARGYGRNIEILFARHSAQLGLLVAGISTSWWRQAADLGTSKQTRVTSALLIEEAANVATVAPDQDLADRGGLAVLAHWEPRWQCAYRPAMRFPISTGSSLPLFPHSPLRRKRAPPQLRAARMTVLSPTGGCKPGREATPLAFLRTSPLVTHLLAIRQVYSQEPIPRLGRSALQMEGPRQRLRSMTRRPPDRVGSITVDTNSRRPGDEACCFFHWGGSPVRAQRRRGIRGDCCLEGAVQTRNSMHIRTRRRTAALPINCRCTSGNPIQAL